VNPKGRVNIIFAGILFICLSSGALFAEDRIGQLEKRLQSVTGEERLELLNLLARGCWMVSPEKSIAYGNDAQALAVEQGNRYQELSALKNLAGGYYFIGEINRALTLISDILEQEDVVYHPAIVGDARLILGMIYSDTGDYGDANEHLLAAVEAYTEAESVQGQYYAYNLLGQNHESLLHYSEALEYYNMAMEMQKQLGGEGESGLVLSNIGNIYRKMGMYQKALDFYAEALARIEEGNEQYLRGATLLAIGETYFRREDMDMAYRFGTEALDTAQQAGALDLERDCYRFLSMVDEASGRYREALTNFKQYVLLYESFINERLLGRLQQLRLQHQLDEKEKTIEELHKQSSLRKQSRNFLIIFSVLIVAVAFVVFFLYRSKQKTAAILMLKNKELSVSESALKVSNNTKNKLLSIIAHDVRNPVSVMMSGLQLLLDPAVREDEPSRRNLLSDLKRTSLHLYSLLENLLHWVKTQKEELAAAPTTIDVGRAVSRDLNLISLHARQKQITVVNEIDVGVLIRADETMFHTIIRNLLTNSLKFTRKGGTITLQAHSGSGRVAVSVRDTGVGMNNEIKRKLFDDSIYLSTDGTDAEKGAGLGLMLCKELVEKNDGALYVESEPGKGSTVTVCFPEGRHPN